MTSRLVALLIVVAVLALWVRAADAQARVPVQAPVRPVLTPIPEPGTWLLMAVGIGAVLWYCRRKP